MTSRTREIRRKGEQSVADGGPGESQEQRPDARSSVDPRSKPGGEGDSAERSRRQDGAQRKGAEARLIDEKQHDVGAGDRVREAGEHVDDDKRDEESRAIDVRWQEGPRCCGRACPTRVDSDGGRRLANRKELIDERAALVYSKSKTVSPGATVATSEAMRQSRDRRRDGQEPAAPEPLDRRVAAARHLAMTAMTFGSRRRRRRLSETRR